MSAETPLPGGHHLKDLPVFVDPRAIWRKLLNFVGRRSKRAASRRIDPRPGLHAFWRRPAPAGNEPWRFVEPIGRSRALLSLIEELPRETRILEVGCNVGRNLAHLHDAGFGNLAGLEISPHAVALLRRTYPQLGEIPIEVGAAEDILPRFEDGSFGLVFTMAVLEHIHPSSGSVFEDIVRVAESILAIEPRGHSSHRQYPHNIPKIFTSLGCRLVGDTPMEDLVDTVEDPALAGYHAWRFRCR